MKSKYDTWFSQYVLFADGSLYRFAISYKFDTSANVIHRIVFCRNKGTRTFFPITVMVDYKASDAMHY